MGGFPDRRQVNFVRVEMAKLSSTVVTGVHPLSVVLQATDPECRVMRGLGVEDIRH